MKNLTIITPCSRPHNLMKMRQSVPLDIRWIIVFDFETREDVGLIPIEEGGMTEFHFLKIPAWGYPQSNLGIELCKKGFMYFLDDDTILHPDFVSVMRKLLPITKAEFIHFDQIRPNGRRIGGVVEVGKIDKGSYVVSRELVGDLRYGTTARISDGLFAKAVFEKTRYSLYIQKVLTLYNALRNE